MNKGVESFIYNRNEAGVIDFCVRIAATDHIINVVDWAHHCGMSRPHAQAIFNNPFNSSYTYPFSGWNGDAALQWRLIMPFLREMVQGGVLEEKFCNAMRAKLHMAHQHTFPQMYKKKA
jgi:hypothetical protein